MDREEFRKDVKLAVCGDKEAFSRLYALVYEELYHTAFYSLRNEHDAADAVSDTVLDAYNSIGKLRSEEAFRSWIFKILWTKIKRKRAEYLEDASDIDAPEYENMLHENFKFESLELAEAMYRIDDDERTILAMSVLSGYSGDEIAHICGMNPSTVRSKLMRTKEKLKKLITG
ncbi:MAG: sigma-70 family RNA polymerase sigma factor [Oscillospiraceae bacterium]|nr:sigma-70 family RNA polymerase sigma factor [Oscillospiraceae bacterium]